MSTKKKTQMPAAGNKKANKAAKSKPVAAVVAVDPEPVVSEAVYDDGTLEAEQPAAELVEAEMQPAEEYQEEQQPYDEQPVYADEQQQPADEAATEEAAALDGSDEQAYYEEDGVAPAADGAYEEQPAEVAVDENGEQLSERFGALQDEVEQIEADERAAEAADDEQQYEAAAEEFTPAADNEVADVNETVDDFASQIGGDDAVLVSTLRSFEASLQELFQRYVSAPEAAPDSEANVVTLQNFITFTAEYSLVAPASPSRPNSAELDRDHDPSKNPLMRAQVKDYFLQNSFDSNEVIFAQFVALLVTLAQLVYQHAIAQGVDTSLSSEASLSEQTQYFFSENLGLFVTQGAAEIAFEPAPAAVTAETEPEEQPQAVEEVVAAPEPAVSARKKKLPTHKAQGTPQQELSTPVSAKKRKKAGGSKIPAPSSATPSKSLAEDSRHNSAKPSRLQPPSPLPSDALSPMSANADTRPPLSPLINTKNTAAKMISPTPSGPQSRLSPPTAHTGHAIITKLTQQLQSFSPTPSTKSLKQDSSYASSYTTTTKPINGSPSLLPSIGGTASKEKQQQFLQAQAGGPQSPVRGPVPIAFPNSNKKKHSQQPSLDHQISAPAPTLAPIVGASSNKKKASPQPELTPAKSLPPSLSEPSLLKNTSHKKKGKKRQEEALPAALSPSKIPIRDSTIAEERALEKDIKALNNKLFHQVSLIHQRHTEAAQEAKKADKERKKREAIEAAANDVRRNEPQQLQQQQQHQSPPAPGKKSKHQQQHSQPFLSPIPVAAPSDANESLKKKERRLRTQAAIAQAQHSLHILQMHSESDVSPLPSVRTAQQSSNGSGPKKKKKKKGGKNKQQQQAQPMDDGGNYSDDGFDSNSQFGGPSPRAHTTSKAEKAARDREQRSRDREAAQSISQSGSTKLRNRAIEVLAQEAKQEAHRQQSIPTMDFQNYYSVENQGPYIQNQSQQFNTSAMQAPPSGGAYQWPQPYQNYNYPQPQYYPQPSQPMYYPPAPFIPMQTAPPPPAGVGPPPHHPASAHFVAAYQHPQGYHPHQHHAFTPQTGSKTTQQRAETFVNHQVSSSRQMSNEVSRQQSTAASPREEEYKDETFE